MTQLSVWAGRFLLLCAIVLLPATILFKSAPNAIIIFMSAASFALLLDQERLVYLKHIPKVIYIFSLFIVWAIASSLWSPDFILSFATGVKIGAALIAGLALHAMLVDSFRGKFITWLTFGYFIGLTLSLIELRGYGAIYKLLHPNSYNTAVYNHGIALLILLLWPIIGFYAKSQKRLVILLIPAICITVFISTFHAAILALAVGLISWTLCLFLPRFFMRTAAIVTAVVILGFPWVVNQFTFEQIIENSQSVLVKLSYHHRLVILKRTGQMIAEKPYIGHGINTFSLAFDQNKLDQADFSRLESPENAPLTKEDIEIYGQALHPHNFTMQIWYELGAVGAILVAVFLFSLLWLLSSSLYSRTSLATFSGLYTTVFTLMHVSFGAWQTWWIFTLALALSLIFSRMNSEEVRS